MVEVSLCLEINGSKGKETLKVLLKVGEKQYEAEWDAHRTETELLKFCWDIGDWLETNLKESGYLLPVQGFRLRPIETKGTASFYFRRNLSDLVSGIVQEFFENTLPEGGWIKEAV